MSDQTSATVKLASIVRVEGYKRRGDGGRTEHVGTYLRQIRDALNALGGPDVAAQRGITTGPDRAPARTSRADVINSLKDISLSGRSRPPAEGTLQDPINVGDDLDQALRYLADGLHVRLEQPDQVTTLIDKMNTWIDQVKTKGGQAPNFNLCSVTVKNTNLFCAETKGVPRVKMPQLGGVPLPGSPAEAKLAPGQFKVNLSDDFRDALNAIGVAVESKTVRADHLRATQSELSAEGVAQMSRAMAEGKIREAPIFVSRDGYVIDGHHRWAAKIVLDSADNHYGDTQMQVDVVDLDIGAVLDFANEFTARMGIRVKGHGQTSDSQAGQTLAASNTDCGCAPTPAEQETHMQRDQAMAILRNRVGRPSPETDAIVRLSKIIKINAYRRKGDRGETVNVDSYVRKIRDAFGVGADSKTKKAITIYPGQQQKAASGRSAASLRDSQFAPAKPKIDPVKVKVRAKEDATLQRERDKYLAKKADPKAQAKLDSQRAKEDATLQRDRDKYLAKKADPKFQAKLDSQRAKEDSALQRDRDEFLAKKAPAKPPVTDEQANRSIAQKFQPSFVPNYPSGSAKPTEATDGWSMQTDARGRTRLGMDQETYDAHRERVENVLKANMHLATDKVHATNVDGKPVWSPERTQAHNVIIADILDRALAPGSTIGRDKKAVMSGGLGGAGKSTTLADPRSNVPESNFLVLNPDEMKDELIRRNLAPQVDGLQPMEAATLLHEESSHLALMLADRAQSLDMNVIWDITMASPGSVQSRLNKLRDNGYDTSAVFVDIPVEKSVERALGRHKRGVEEFAAEDQGLGGRFVKPSHIQANAPSEGSPFNSKNRETFESLKDQFYDWQVWDTSGAESKKVEEIPNGTERKWADGNTYVKIGPGDWKQVTARDNLSFSVNTTQSDDGTMESGEEDV